MDRVNAPAVSCARLTHAERKINPYSTPFAYRVDNKLVIEIELPACGELSRGGRAENLVDPSVWLDYEDDREFIGIKMTVCRPLSYRNARKR